MKSPSPRTLHACAKLAGIVLLLTGCDGGPQEAPRSSTPSDPDAPQTPAAPPVPTAASPDQIKGKVVFDAPPPPARTIQMGPICGELHTTSVTVTDYAIGDGNGLANVFVHIKEGLAEEFPPPSEQPLLDQEGCLYHPSILTVWAGQPFQVRNSDPLLHNVHSFPNLNKAFNFGQVVKGQITTRTFDTPETLVRVKCDVHPWMICHINVVNHPFHAITDQDGNFALPPGLPPGIYTLEAVHPEAGAVTTQFTSPQPSPEPITLTLQSQ